MPRASTLIVVSMPCVGRPSIFGETLRYDVGAPALNCSSPVMPRAVKRLAAAAFVAASSGPFAGGAMVGAGTGGGPAIIVGHVDWAGKAGVFYKLRTIRPGALITVVRADGSTAVFAVSSVAEYLKDSFPTDKVYGNTTNAALRIITCGGVFNPKVHSYEDDIVAYAELVSSTPA